MIDDEPVRFDDAGAVYARGACPSGSRPARALTILIREPRMTHRHVDRRRARCRDRVRHVRQRQPATEEVLGTAPEATVADADRAVAAARRAFDTTGWSTDAAFPSGVSRPNCKRVAQTRDPARHDRRRKCSPVMLTRATHSTARWDTSATTSNSSTGTSSNSPARHRLDGPTHQRVVRRRRPLSSRRSRRGIPVLPEHRQGVRGIGGGSPSSSSRRRTRRGTPRDRPARPEETEIPPGVLNV